MGVEGFSLLGLARVEEGWRFFFFNKVILFLFIFGCIGSLLLHVGFLSSCGEQGLLFLVVCRLLIVVASLVVEHRIWARGLSSCGSRALERRLSSCGTRA